MPQIPGSSGYMGTGDGMDKTVHVILIRPCDIQTRRAPHTFRFQEFTAYCNSCHSTRLDIGTSQPAHTDRGRPQHQPLQVRHAHLFRTACSPDPKDLCLLVASTPLDRPVRVDVCRPPHFFSLLSLHARWTVLQEVSLPAKDITDYRYLFLGACSLERGCENLCVHANSTSSALIHGIPRHC